MTRSRTTVGVLVGDDAPMLEIAVAPRVFGLVQGRGGEPMFDIRVAGEHGGPLSTTAGMSINAPCPLDALEDAGLVIVPGWRPPGGPPVGAGVLDVLRRARADGAIVVGLCLGAFVLAEAGLLDGRRATTHWRYLAEFAERFPAVDVVGDALFVDEGGMLTSAGSAAGLDTCLHLLRREHGPAAAARVARALVVAPQRPGAHTQLVERPIPLTGDEIGDAMRHALDHLDDPALDVADLAAAARMSRRTFDRRFRQTTGFSVLQWLLHQRVLRAQHVLSTTDLPMDAVARASGFADAVAMRPHFRRVTGLPPQSFRAGVRTLAAQRMTAPPAAPMR